jgi:hypothetical protein
MMSLGTVFQIGGLFALAVFFLLVASAKIQLYWGRRGTDLPFTHIQQKVFGVAFGAGMLVVAVGLTCRATLPGSITDVKWEQLETLALIGPLAITWITALIDPRTKNSAGTSFGGGFVMKLSWMFGVLFSLIALCYLWLLVH